MKKFNQTFLVCYSFLVTAAFIATVLMVFKERTSTHLKVKELEAEQIKIVEPDGTLRLLLSNKDKFPPTSYTVKGKVVAEERPQAGMLFYNDEGAENGGLIFAGRKNSNGRIINAGASLSFDRYGGNQEVQLIGVNDSEDQFAGLNISDSHPDTKKNSSRIWVGRDEKGSAEVALMDSTGKRRLVMKVTDAGESSIKFFDNQGHELSSFAPSLAKPK